MKHVAPLLLVALASPAGATTISMTSAYATPPHQHDFKMPSAHSTTSAPIDRPNAPGARGSAGSALDPSPPPGAFRAPIHDQLWFATEEDGSTWVRGRTYKARFGPGGATYIPYFGSRAPRNFPVELSLASASVGGAVLALAPAASAVRDGDRLVIDRGPIDEVYELALDHVEQTFVIEERPASGDLRLVVSLQSELSPRTTAAGFELTNELGSVRYGHAFVREPSGVRVPLISRLVEGGIEIEVAESYLATAHFPLVVDPVVMTFAVETSSPGQFEAETAYDVTTDRIMVVYQYPFSLDDNDIVAEGFGPTGILVGFVTIDFSTENWLHPQAANLNSADQFLCAAEARNVAGSVTTVIRGRTVAAATFAMSAKFNISTTDQSGDKLIPDIGSDPYEVSGLAYYCVTWWRDFSSGDMDIHARLVRPDRTLVGAGTILIDNSGATIDGPPAISKADGQLGNDAAWTIVWRRTDSSSIRTLRAARLRWDGTIQSPSAHIPSEPIPLSVDPCVSSPLADGRTLLVYGLSAASDEDVHYVLLSGTTPQSSGRLTDLDSPSTQPLRQSMPSVDSDGERFVVAYSEHHGGSSFDWDLWIGTFAPLGTTLLVTEARQALDTSPGPSWRSDLASHWSGGGSSPRFVAVWDDFVPPSGDRNVFAGFYDRPLGGGYQVFCTGDIASACPCGNTGAVGHGCANSLHASGALLAASGNSETAAGDTLSMTVLDVPPNVTATLFQGTSTSGAFFGDGLRCTFGGVVRIASKNTGAAGTATWPSGSDAAISVTGIVALTGARHYYQVSYRNSASFCTSATFNISNGMNVLWLP